MRKLIDALLFCIPRFITEDVALELTDEGDYEIVCSMSDIEPGERFDGVVEVTSLAFMWWAYAPQINGEVRPWPELRY